MLVEKLFLFFENYFKKYRNSKVFKVKIACKLYEVPYFFNINYSGVVVFK